MPERPADLVLRSGALHTVDAGRPAASAIAVQAGRIVAVGSDGTVDGRIGPRTRVVELRGRTVLPGFQDAHAHPIHAGLDMVRCDLHERHGLATYLQLIREHAERNPDAGWILGGGWAMGDFPGGTPRRDELDRVVPDRPAFLTNRDLHGAWVNTRALALAGIDAATPDPLDGRIERGTDGTPSGTLHEGAMDLVERLIPPATASDHEAALLLAQSELLRLGVTSWQDAWLSPQILAAYRAVAGRGQLSGRTVGALWWDRGAGLEQIERLLEWRAEGSIGRFRPTSVKIMQDGVLENYTGAVLDPYLDPEGRPGKNRGISFVDPALLNEAVTRLDAAGFQVHIHAIGDRAVRESLDAFATAGAANGPSDGRHHIAHLQLIHPDDVPRFAMLDVTANAQPYWACHDAQMDDLTIPFLGTERTGWQYPFRSLLRAGARLAMGSDWSVSTANPLLEMEVAVNRVSDHARGTAEPFLAGERISLDDAIRAFTMGSAYVQHHDDETGSLSVGKLADMVVLDRDLFDRRAGPIGDARVIATFIEGQAVFETREVDD